MAIGRTFQESIQKALRGLETGVDGFDPMLNIDDDNWKEKLRHKLQVPGCDRIYFIADAFRQNYSVEDVFLLTNIDPWFLVQIEELVHLENQFAKLSLGDIDHALLWKMKRKGFSDLRLAAVMHVSEKEIRKLRHGFDLHPVYKRVDTCAAEFSTDTAYLYSTYEDECEANPSNREKIMIIGGGPNRIGQGIEFDYCCVHAAFAMRDDGYETIMVNCNPETVSTDFDTSDRLYFEPVTLEDVLEIVAKEKPKGVIVQYGGQTPLKLARDLEAAGVPIIGTSPDAIDRSEDRERFQRAIERLGLKQPPNRTARNVEDGVRLAEEIGYPLVVRPSYVLGGRAMEIVFNVDELRRYMTEAVSVSNESPVLLDRFLNDAIEVDIDAIYDGETTLMGGIMEHIEQAGVHSGDSACCIPPHTLTEATQARLQKQIEMMAKELQVRGLMNTQFAIQGDDIYVLEVNPRASRTVPFVSKATGRPLAKIAASVMAGRSLKEQGVVRSLCSDFFTVKEPVFPFNKFPGSDPILGPEMKSTGEAMGVGESFGEAYYKAQLGSGSQAPRGGKAILSVKDSDKAKLAETARALAEVGYEIYATGGTAKKLIKEGIFCQRINKVYEGRPHLVDMIKNDEIDYIVNTTEGAQAVADSYTIRRSALQHKVAYTTTLAAGFATAQAISHQTRQKVNTLQKLHLRVKETGN